MPVALALDYEDGSSEELRIPVEVWRRNSDTVAKLVITPKTLAKVTLDPHLEIADTDLSNNHWPPEMEQQTFQLTSGGARDAKPASNPMRDAAEAKTKNEPKPVEAGASGTGRGGG